MSIALNCLTGWRATYQIYPVRALTNELYLLYSVSIEKYNSESRHFWRMRMDALSEHLTQVHLDMEERLQNICTRIDAIEASLARTGGYIWEQEREKQRLLEEAKELSAALSHLDSCDKIY